MMGPLLLVLFLAAGGPARADVVDFTAVFDDDFRDQCDTSSCHAFASVAILEAAMKRRRRDAETVYLSDADLFLRASVINGVLMYRPGYEGRPPEVALMEGGWPSRDLRLALEEGVAREETVPWTPFLRKFRDFRARQRSGELAPAPPSPERAQAETQYFYGRALPQARADREETRRLLAGFTVHSSTFSSPALGVEEAARCRAAGQAVKARLMEDLAVRRPLVICLSLDGLPEWGAPPEHSRHCVAVRGYRKPRGGDMALFVRNSWGNERHPDVPEHRFCRIHEVTSVRP